MAASVVIINPAKFFPISAASHPNAVLISTATTISVLGIEPKAFVRSYGERAKFFRLMQKVRELPPRQSLSDLGLSLDDSVFHFRSDVTIDDVSAIIAYVIINSL